MPGFNGRERETIPEHTFVVGGSAALRLYLGAHVPYSGLDVVCSCYAPDKSKNADTMGLYNEKATISGIYERLGKVSVKLSKDNIMRGPDPDVEDFDKAIVGTINVVLRDGFKIQYVFVNMPNAELVDWYASASHLPVFCVLESERTVFKIKNRLTALAARCGVLFGIKHKYRQQKYRENGFWVF